MKLKRKTLIITVVVITIIIIISGCLLLTNKGNNEIIGFWTIDGYTNYEFLNGDIDGLYTKEIERYLYICLFKITIAIGFMW